MQGNQPRDSPQQPQQSDCDAAPEGHIRREYRQKQEPYGVDRAKREHPHLHVFEESLLPAFYDADASG